MCRVDILNFRNRCLNSADLGVSSCSTTKVQFAYWEADERTNVHTKKFGACSSEAGCWWRREISEIPVLRTESCRQQTHGINIPPAYLRSELTLVWNLNHTFRSNDLEIFTMKWISYNWANSFSNLCIMQYQNASKLKFQSWFKEKSVYDNCIISPIKLLLNQYPLHGSSNALTGKLELPLLITSRI
jgi:hypothetical protein